MLLNVNVSQFSFVFMQFQQAFIIFQHFQLFWKQNNPEIINIEQMLKLVKWSSNSCGSLESKKN